MKVIKILSMMLCLVASMMFASCASFADGMAAAMMGYAPSSQPYYVAAQGLTPQPNFGNYGGSAYFNPSVQASIGVANSSNVVMQANQAIMQQYQTAIDNGWYYTPTTTSTYNEGSPNSSSSSSRQKKSCGACDGKGWVPETKGVSSHGNNKWCDGCRKTVPANHYHAQCPSCKGAGEW